MTNRPGLQLELGIDSFPAFDILTNMCIAFAAACAPLVQSVRQGRPWAFYTLALVSTMWVLSCMLPLTALADNRLQHLGSCHREDVHGVSLQSRRAVIQRADNRYHFCRVSCPRPCRPWAPAA